MEGIYLLREAMEIMLDRYGSTKPVTTGMLVEAINVAIAEHEYQEEQRGMDDFYPDMNT